MLEGLTSDRKLAKRMLAGREDAFEEFFEGYFPRLYRFALVRLNHDADAAEEVVQVVLSQAVRKIASYRGEAALFTWLCTFCRREIGARQRRRGGAPVPLDLVEETPEIRAALESLAAPGAADPEKAVRCREVARLVQVTLDSLPGSYGDALEWRYIGGHSVKEIAVRLRLSPKAAESLLTRARQAFRDGFSILAGGTRGLDTLTE